MDYKKAKKRDYSNIGLNMESSEPPVTTKPLQSEEL